MKGIALDPSAPRTVQVGYAPDPADSTLTDLLVAQVDNDGLSVNAVLMSSGTSFHGNAVDVDASGHVYVAATMDGTGVVMRLELAPVSVDWALPAGSALNGIKLDAIGANLYVAGANPGVHATDAYVVRLTNLANSMPTTVYANTRSSTIGPSYANAVAVASDGRADVASSVEFANLGNNYFSPGVFQLEADGSNRPGWGFPALAGDMNAVAVDTDNLQYFDGTAVDTTAGPGKGMIVAKLVPVLGGDQSDFQWAWFYSLPSGRDLTANGAAVNIAGNLFTAGSADVGGANGLDVVVLKLSADGRSVLDRGTAGGTGTDIANGLALTTFLSDDVSNDLLYLAGTTTSPDIPDALGTFAGPWDGLIVADVDPLKWDVEKSVDVGKTITVGPFSVAEGIDIHEIVDVKDGNKVKAEKVEHDTKLKITGITAGTAYLKVTLWDAKGNDVGFVLLCVKVTAPSPPPRQDGDQTITDFADLSMTATVTSTAIVTPPGVSKSPGFLTGGGGKTTLAASDVSLLAPFSPAVTSATSDAWHEHFNQAAAPRTLATDDLVKQAIPKQSQVADLRFRSPRVDGTVALPRSQAESLLVLDDWFVAFSHRNELRAP